MRKSITQVALCLIVLAAASACFGGGGGKPDDAVKRFVAAINDADFNDAHREFTDDCRDETSLAQFQETYGTTLLAMGIGRGGAFGATSLKAEEMEVTRTGAREAAVTLDWVLYTSIDSPLPLFGTIADERVPLETVLDVRGTADRPLYVLDVSGSGDWRLEDCDPLGLKALFEQQQDLYDELRYYYDQLDY